MSWKRKLNIAGSYIISEEVDGYLKKHGFYESTLRPRFFGEETYRDQIMDEDAPCLRLDTDDPENRDYTMRIFITEKEVYMEVQNSWRSFDRSYHMVIEDEVTMENIDEILDKISDH